MLLFPNCKINIGLRVVARRADGYHDIETLMVPVRGLCDIVEIVHAPGDGAEFVSSPSIVLPRKIFACALIVRCTSAFR